MTVKQLRDMLAELPATMPVLCNREQDVVAELDDTYLVNGKPMAVLNIFNLLES